MADLSRIKDNVAKMASMNAPEEDIDGYIKSEGVTVDDVKNYNPSSDGNAGAILAGTTAGAAAVGGYAATRVFNRPARQIKSKEVSLDQIKKDYLNEPFVDSKDVPGRIQQKSNMEQQKMVISSSKEKANLQKLESAKSKLSQKLSDDLSNFDNQVLNKTVEEFGSQLKQTFPKVVNQTYKNYGLKLDEFQKVLESKNVALNAYSFADDVLNKAGIDSIKAGVPEASMGKLFSLRDVLKSTYRNDTSLSLSQLKGNVDALAADLPQAAAIKLRDSWGSFLSNNAQEIDSDFHLIQKDYSKFANMRDSIYDSMQGGEFDKNKVNKLLFDYAKSKAETGLTDTVRLMAEGNNIVTGMPEIKAPFEKLQGVVSARKVIQSSGKSMLENKGSEIESSMARINDINTRIQESKLNSMQWVNKADQILSEQAAIVTKYPIRSGGIGRVISNVAGVAQRAASASGARALIGRSVLPIQAVSAILQANEFISDPAVGWGNAIGVEVPKKGTKERLVLEEFVNKKPIPPEVQIGDEEKFNILRGYGLAI